MYVIYVNDRPIRLLSGSTPSTSPDLVETPSTHLTARYGGKAHSLLNYVDMLEKGSPKVKSVDIVHDDLEVLWKDFKGHFEWIAAAGGIVNRQNSAKVLFIYRRGFWDLPKGKLDPGEDAPTAALREVQEETGLKEVSLGEQLPTTYHTYRKKKGARVLKPTYWYRMESNQLELRPEAAEGIERAEWREIRSVLDDELPIYHSLRHLLENI
ncbi:NUDIX hydrolase [Neolewinella antarctica]|uniref:8-oxo-dGTP pyrophosphatase MutT (NUDIX family) n=1 Tax=Neolewinella antarctica TaxID=442734 RepID=A0ABX0XED4_9BACT|nr:NUDIX domain-containing protein [Neolewinella antarctica]NJC27253.1 8-oxo-dGTP pyrophosphatase MutT (NUDIX family) [Neolewinella antarctica]